MPLSYVYIVGSCDYKRVKVGYWRSTISKLRARYITCYGNDLFLETFETQCPEMLEKVFQSKFLEHCVCCELYRLDGIEMYKEFLNAYCTKTIDELTTEIEPRQTKSEVREAFTFYLQECGLDYILTDGYNIINHTKNSYQMLTNYDSDSLKRILETIKSMSPQDGIKFKYKRVINTLYVLIVIRRYIEVTQSVEIFSTDKIITVKDVKKKELAQQVVDEDGELYLNAMRYVLEAKHKTPDTIKGSNNIHKIIHKALKVKSYKRQGSHRKGYSKFVIQIDID